MTTTTTVPTEPKFTMPPNTEDLEDDLLHILTEQEPRRISHRSGRNYRCENCGGFTLGFAAKRGTSYKMLPCHLCDQMALRPYRTNQGIIDDILDGTLKTAQDNLVSFDYAAWTILTADRRLSSAHAAGLNAEFGFSCTTGGTLEERLASAYKGAGPRAGRLIATHATYRDRAEWTERALSAQRTLLAYGSEEVPTEVTDRIGRILDQWNEVRFPRPTVADCDPEELQAELTLLGLTGTYTSPDGSITLDRNDLGAGFIATGHGLPSRGCVEWFETAEEFFGLILPVYASARQRALRMSV